MPTINNLPIRMGNTHARKNYRTYHQTYASQYSLSDVIGGSCAGSAQTSPKETRSYYRASRRSLNETTLQDRLGSSKTLWPVPRFESMFLPEFQVKEVRLKNEYAFLSVISKGAYGRVYKVRKLDTGQIFALKVISKAKIVSENAVMQAKQEVAIQRMVGHHPFILDCTNRWQGRKTLYILTEYIGGGELFSLVEEHGCLPEDVVRIYVAEIALAIDFLHNAGVVHRDLKASNVLLTNEGHAVIIDFGLAKWLHRTERTNTFCGTPEYMAPEILNRQFYGQEVDWWSLGVLTCFMLTNQITMLRSLKLPTDDIQFNSTLFLQILVQKKIESSEIINSWLFLLPDLKECVNAINKLHITYSKGSISVQNLGTVRNIYRVEDSPSRLYFANVDERRKEQFHKEERATESRDGLKILNPYISYPAAASSDLSTDPSDENRATPLTLPADAEISPAAADLLRRLLQPDPRLRLRSILGLQRIAFYMGRDLQSYMLKEESPFRLLGRKPRRESNHLQTKFLNF